MTTPAAALRFDGRVVVVTGAGRGVGRALAELLAARGARVVVDDVGTTTTGDPDDPGLAERVAAELVAAGGEALAADDDTVTPEGARDLVSRTLDHWGRLDAVVAVAGISWHRPLAEVTPDDLARAYAVNAAAPLWLAQAAWPALAASGAGRIVTVSSAGVFGTAGRVHYAMAKAAVIGMTRVLAVEGRAEDIGVNCTLPWAATRMATATGEAARRMAERVPPSAVAPGMAWLAHPACTTTGEVFALEGGRMARVVLGSGPGIAVAATGPEDYAARWTEVMAVDPLVVPADTADYGDLAVRPALRTLRPPPPAGGPA